MSEQRQTTAAAMQLSFDFDAAQLPASLTSSIGTAPLASVVEISSRRELQARKQDLEAYSRLMAYAQRLRRV